MNKHEHQLKNNHSKAMRVCKDVIDQHNSATSDTRFLLRLWIEYYVPLLKIEVAKKNIDGVFDMMCPSIQSNKNGNILIGLKVIYRCC